MFTIEILANYSAFEHRNTSICLFTAEYRNLKEFSYHVSPTLDFPTIVLITPNILNGIAVPLINIAILEFISAQSPYAMKGLLLGVFYAFRGLFTALGCALAIPFAQDTLWRDHHSIFNCGFYYFLSTTVLAILALLVFLMASKRYQRRVRDDPPYNVQYVEDYYSYHTESSQRTKLLKEENNLAPYGTS